MNRDRGLTDAMGSVFKFLLLFGFSVLASVHGVYGLLENVALHKKCTMSSSYYTSVPTQDMCRRALDGARENGGSMEEGDSCAHSGVDDSQPRFQVDLGRRYPILYITIIAPEKHPDRMSNCRITVDGEECYRFPQNPDSKGPTMNVTCTRPLSGQVIRIIKVLNQKSARENPLNFCELQVFSCGKGAWGRGCDEQCGHCAGDQDCDKVNGHCEHCARGTKPPYCLQPKPYPDDTNMVESSSIRSTEMNLLFATLAAVVVSLHALPWTSH